MNPIFLILKAYWMQLTALGICLFIIGYIGVLRHENNALKLDNSSLKQTIETVRNIGKEQNEKAQRLEQGAHEAVTLQAQQGQSDINKIKAYYEAHPIVKHVAVSVRDHPANSGSSQLSGVPVAAQESPSSGADADTAASGQSLEYQCAVTTSQYNTLYQSWVNACVASACK